MLKLIEHFSTNITKKIEFVNIETHLQLSDCKSNTNGGKILQNLANQAVITLFYPPPGSRNYHMFYLNVFHKAPIIHHHYSIMTSSLILFDVYQVN